MSYDPYPQPQNSYPYHINQAGQTTQPQYSAGQAGPSPFSSGPAYPPVPPKSRKKPIIIGLIVSVILIVVTVLAVVTHNLLPASAATVTIVPEHQSLIQTHAFSLAATSDFANDKIATHQISYTTPASTKRENTTNIDHLAATMAKGQLVIIPQNATSSGGIKNMIIHGANGLDVYTDQGYYISLSPGQATTVPAHIAKAGAVGNVSAYFINGNYNPGDDPGLILRVYNPAPFSGGADGYDGPVIQASDLTQVENDLTTQLEQDAQQNLQKQLKQGEGLLQVKCVPHITTQPQAGSRGATMTASGTETCTGTAYDQQGLQNWMQTDLQQTASQRFGPHLGQVRTSGPDITLFTDSIKVFAQSDWVVKFDTDGKKALAQAIMGKSQDEARSILTKQFFVRTTNISVSGWGIYMPTDPSTIKFVAQDNNKSSPTSAY